MKGTIIYSSNYIDRSCFDFPYCSNDGFLDFPILSSALFSLVMLNVTVDSVLIANIEGNVDSISAASCFRRRYVYHDAARAQTYGIMFIGTQ